jgi:hypothetical protein
VSDGWVVSLTPLLDDQPEFIDGMSMLYDRHGNPIGMRTHAVLHDDYDYRVIGLACIAGFRISTVWLGSHTFCVEPPMIFETMICGVSPEQDKLWGPWLREMADFGYRYPTEGAAWAGHWIVCLLMQAELLMRGLAGGQLKMIEAGERWNGRLRTG